MGDGCCLLTAANSFPGRSSTGIFLYFDDASCARWPPWAGRPYFRAEHHPLRRRRVGSLARTAVEYRQPAARAKHATLVLVLGSIGVEFHWKLLKGVKTRKATVKYWSYK
jgi:hypothetical protein